jgi:hypothetical protein
VAESTFLPEPSDQVADPRELLLAYLDFYRDTAVRKVSGLTELQARSSRLPSGWTPLELLNHLRYMERRWLQWGFAAEPVAEPRGDDDPDTGRWRVAEDVTTADVIAGLRAVGERTRALVAGRQLTDLADTGGRFPAGEQPPALSWILLHVLQEYARHVGHLDIVRELADGAVGE